MKKLSPEEWNEKVPMLWRDVLSGLNHLHTHKPNKFLHRDIKVHIGAVLGYTTTFTGLFIACQNIQYNCFYLEFFCYCCITIMKDHNSILFLQDVIEFL